jgi:hypothetical protein
VLLMSEIELAKGVDAEAFGDFFRDEFLPAVFTGQTRVGKVEGMELLEREEGETDHSFVVLARWSGLLTPEQIVRVRDADVQAKLEKMAVIKDPVVWQVAGTLGDG